MPVQGNHGIPRALYSRALVAGPVVATGGGMRNSGTLFRPIPSERPLYPIPVLEDYEVKLGEIRKFGGFPLTRTEDGWAVVEHVDLAGVTETED